MLAFIASDAERRSSPRPSSGTAPPCGPCRHSGLYDPTPRTEHGSGWAGPGDPYARSSAPDTDSTAKLVDVHPDGKVYSLEKKIIRARLRESLEKRTAIEPGKVYEYKIDLWPTSNLFRPGHRIGLEISSSNFPHYDGNPNTGAEFGQETTFKIDDQTILHDMDNPSRIILPIIPTAIQ